MNDNSTTQFIRKGRATRASIVTAAAQMMFERGVANTSVDKVHNAARADVVAFHTWADACMADIDIVYRKGGCVYGSLAGDVIDSDDEVRDNLAAGYDQWIGLFAAGLTAMRRRGELQPEATHDTSRRRSSSHTRAAPCSPTPPLTHNHCG